MMKLTHLVLVELFIHGLQAKMKNKEVTSQQITMMVNWKKDEELEDSECHQRI